MTDFLLNETFPVHKGPNVATHFANKSLADDVSSAMEVVRLASTLSSDSSPAGTTR